jgi:hypothetical protein
MGLYGLKNCQNSQRLIFQTYDEMMLTHGLSPGRRTVRILRTPASQRLRKGRIGERKERRRENRIEENEGGRRERWGGKTVTGL